MTVLLEAFDIPVPRLALLLIPLAIVLLVFRRYRMGLERRLVLSDARAAVQLSIIGYVLIPLFDLGDSPFVLLVIALMCSLAAIFSLTVVGRRLGIRYLVPAVVSILPVVIGLAAFALEFVVPEAGLLAPRYAIPIAGMLAGNAMTAVSLAGERYVTGIEEQRARIEWAFCLGAGSAEAARSVARNALTAAVTPSLNSLVGVGLVSIPGMLSGQVIAGGDPLTAARYQMLIMACWTAAACLAPALFIGLLRLRLLKGDRLEPGTPIVRVHVESPPPGPSASGPLAFTERPPEGCEGGFL